MALSADLINLILLCAQQLGVTLAVGAAMAMLAAYVAAMRDGVFDEKESQMSRAVGLVRGTGLAFIIVSGVIITLLHIAAGNTATVLWPPYLFKWVLIAGILIFSFAGRWIPRFVNEGIMGGSWLALFFVHVLAPSFVAETTWTTLFELYIVFMFAFGICWAALLYLLRDTKPAAPIMSKAPAIAAVVTPKVPPPPINKPVPASTPVIKPTPPAPKPAMPPAPIPTQAPKVPAPAQAPAPVTVPPKPPPPAPPASTPPVITPAPSPAPTLVVNPKPPISPVPQKPEMPIEDPDKNPNLPAIQVMPRTPQDVANQNRATLVKLD